VDPVWKTNATPPRLQTTYQVPRRAVHVQPPVMFAQGSSEQAEIVFSQLNLEILPKFEQEIVGRRLCRLNRGMGCGDKAALEMANRTASDVFQQMPV